MPTSHLRTVTVGTLLAAILTLFSTSQAQRPVPQPPQPRPSPNTPNPNFPPGLNGPPVTKDIPILDNAQNQAKLHNDVDKLYALVFVLREDMKMTNGKATMSLSIVKQAQQIEKLAKEIKERAKQ